ncbi:MAG: tetratricopeptide repeat protein [Actinomycetota bacterium]|nr:tetratricopeptide repeat protein [Actinomycetota bacterium]
MSPRAGDGNGSSTGPGDHPGAGSGPENPGGRGVPENPAGGGEAYSRFQEGSRLLETGNSHAAVIPLERARELEPEKGSIREALARAYFRSGRIDAAAEEFEKVVELDPVNDYAHFGLGLCLLRRGDRDAARGHLKLATIMRPDAEEYQAALRQASA